MWYSAPNVMVLAAQVEGLGLDIDVCFPVYFSWCLQMISEVSLSNTKSL